MNTAKSLRRAATTLAAVVALLAPFAARAQVVDPSQLDHLKCYRVKDSLQPTRYLADLTNQFGVEPGCTIALPARALCVETEKRVISSPVPPGGGPSGDPAGHFLCYAVRCPTSAAPAEIAVEDQFGRRIIALDRERILCAPANKLICGDGEVDPGEACDPGSAATNLCPGGAPCSTACTCPPGVCCQCPDTCTTASGTICPAGCPAVTGAICEDRFCQTCPCGTTCTDDAGNVGVCREGDDEGPCECRVPPACECGATCVVGGLAGICQPVAGANFCECRPPEGCPCGDPCATPDGEAGHCRPTNDSSVCECRPDETDCPCGAVCTDPNGVVGTCRHQPGNPAGACTCFAPPPDECQCGKPCVDDDGLAGQCRPVPGAPGVCTCIGSPPATACQCGKSCVRADGTAGRCRPVHGSPGECGCQ